MNGIASKPGAFLAYEHSLKFEGDPTTIKARVDEVKSACSEQRFGACSVLKLESTAGDYANASLSLRVVPEGIAPLSALAGEGQALASQETHAEDLADAVANVANSKDLAERQRVSLLDFAGRKDLVVADMISLSQQLSVVDSQLQQLSQESAQQVRRIESNLLHIRWNSNRDSTPATEFSILGIWETFTDNLMDGLQGAAEYAGFLLPMLVLFFPLALIWRWAWRFATRRSRTS